jgi:hypothetical protein
MINNRGHNTGIIFCLIKEGCLAHVSTWMNLEDINS